MISILGLAFFMMVNVLNVKKILAVIYATYAVAKRKFHCKTKLTGGPGSPLGPLSPRSPLSP